MKTLLLGGLCLLVISCTNQDPPPLVKAEVEVLSIHEHEMEMHRKCMDATIKDYLYSRSIKECNALENCVITPDVLAKQFYLLTKKREYCTR